MSSGVSTLIGVLIGGLAWCQAKRADEAEQRAHDEEWLAASRLLSEDLLRLIWDLNAMLSAGVTVKLAYLDSGGLKPVVLRLSLFTPGSATGLDSQALGRGRAGSGSC